MSDIRSVILSKFCDRPPGPMLAERKGGSLRYCLEDDSVGPRLAIDVVLLDRGNEVLARWREAGGGRTIGVDKHHDRVV